MYEIMYIKVFIIHIIKLSNFLILKNLIFLSFSFQNSVTITGLINKTNGFMEPPSENNATFTIFTLKLGNEGTHFATLTGLDGKKLDYGSSAKYRINLLFSKRDGYKENIFQMIAEGVLNF